MQTSILYIKEKLKELYPDSEVSLFVRLIMEHVTGISLPMILMDKNRKISSEQQVVIHDIVSRLEEYEPIQYILGETEFYGLRFLVDKGVLIPRPETEELVEQILEGHKNEALNILDIGTGSGAIAISLKHYLSLSTVTAWDVSPDAIRVAQKNATLNSIDVEFNLVDILSDFPTDKKFDIIVSNPPYVLESEKDAMEANVLDYEPHLALFVPDDRALLFYERIADAAIQQLNPQGMLYFEINPLRSDELVNMLTAKGLKNIELITDISGKQRMSKAQK